MPEQNHLDFSRMEPGDNPFPHFCVAGLLRPEAGTALLAWLEGTDAWSLTEAEFYTQYEFSLLDYAPPIELQYLMTPETIRQISRKLESALGAPPLQLAAVTAHRLVKGHRIGIHNDFIGGEETHRLVIQLNPAWEDAHGGYLILFCSKDAKDVAKLVKPLMGSAFGFEISSRSYHAVSAVHNVHRHSLVYTFKEANDAVSNRH
jgi:Rps23 Pro-64 3,4-dihydroxylase Tpa1-like proline 4-hydroxylase